MLISGASECLAEDIIERIITLLNEPGERGIAALVATAMRIISEIHRITHLLFGAGAAGEVPKNIFLEDADLQQLIQNELIKIDGAFTGTGSARSAPDRQIDAHHGIPDLRQMFRAIAARTDAESDKYLYGLRIKAVVIESDLDDAPLFPVIRNKAAESRMQYGEAGVVHIEKRHDRTITVKDHYGLIGLGDDAAVGGTFRPHQ